MQVILTLFRTSIVYFDLYSCRDRIYNHIVVATNNLRHPLSIPNTVSAPFTTVVKLSWHYVTGNRITGVSFERGGVEVKAWSQKEVLHGREVHMKAGCLLPLECYPRWNLLKAISLFNELETSSLRGPRAVTVTDWETALCWVGSLERIELTNGAHKLTD